MVAAVAFLTRRQLATRAGDQGGGTRQPDADLGVPGGDRTQVGDQHLQKRSNTTSQSRTLLETPAHVDRDGTCVLSFLTEFYPRANKSMGRAPPASGQRGW